MISKSLLHPRYTISLQHLGLWPHSKTKFAYTLACVQFVSEHSYVWSLYISKPPKEYTKYKHVMLESYKEATAYLSDENFLDYKNAKHTKGGSSDSDQ